MTCTPFCIVRQSDRWLNFGRLLAPCLAAFVLLASCCFPAAAGEMSPRACGYDAGPLNERLTCFDMAVPLDRKAKNSTVLTFPVARLKAEAPDADRTPILYLQGGVGAGFLLPKRQPRIAAELSRSRDVIFFDHRGSGQSVPALKCADFNPRDIEKVSLANVKKCAAELATAGLHADQFTTDDAAADVRDLRAALQVRNWDVYAISYGTMVADRLLISDEAGIRRIVLDGSADRIASHYADDFKFDPITDLFDACRADPTCKAEFLDLEGDFFRALDRLPAGVEQKDNKAQFYKTIRTAALTAVGRGKVPDAVHRAAGGDNAVWRELTLENVFDGGAGLDTSLVGEGEACRADVGHRDAKGLYPAAASRIFRKRAPPVASDMPVEYPKLCSVLGVGPGSREAMTLKRTKVPALFLNGEIDPGTPLTWARRIAARYADSRAVNFPLTTHWVFREHPECAGPIIRAFLDDPRARIDLSCVEAMPRTVWQMSER